MNPILILSFAVVGIGLIISWSLFLGFCRWWARPYSKPKRLYRQLRRVNRIPRDKHLAILDKCRLSKADPKNAKPAIDWLEACRMAVELD
jgi:hypothetical protein